MSYSARTLSVLVSVLLLFSLVSSSVIPSQPIYAQEPELVTFEEYYSFTGTLSSRYTAYRSGSDWVLHGTSTQWYMNGQMKMEGEWWRGKKEGVWREWYIDGTRLSEITYSNGLMNGEYVDWYDNGQMQQQGDYIDNLKDGIWTAWDRYGALVSQTDYFDGFKQGTETQYYSNGQKKSQIDYKLDVMDGPASWWWDTGMMSAQGQYLDAVKDGIWKQYYQNGGGIMYATSYQNNVRHGPEDYYTWEPPGYTGGYNGKVFERTEYVNGIAHGTYTKFHPSGNNSVQTEYRYGVKQGATAGFFYGGGTAFSGQYKDGNPAGVWTYWEEDGASYTIDWGSYEPYVDPTAVYTKPSTAKKIKGSITNAQTGRPIPGVLVKASSYETTSGTTGAYELTVGASDSYVVAFTKTGYYAQSQTVDMSGYEYRTLNVKLKKDGPKPAITSVKSRYGTMFFEGVSVNNDYTIAVDWKGNPGKIKVDINGTAYEFAGTQADKVLTFDMGTVPFRAGSAADTNSLKFIAENSDGIQSDPEVLNPVVVPIPEWSRGLGIFAGIPGQQYKYVLKGQWPQDPVEIQVNERTLGPVLWTAWGLFPFIGGRNFGIPPTSASLEVEANSDGSGSVAGTGTTGIEAAGATITGKLGAKGNLQYVSGKGLSWNGADIIIGIGGEIKTERGPVTLIPALENAVNLPVVGRPIRWFNDTAKIVGTISTESTLTPQAIDDQGKLSFKRMEGEFKAGIAVGLAFEMSENVKAEVTGGGVNTVVYQFPADPDYLKKVEAQLFAKLSLQIWLITQEFQASHAFTYDSGGNPLSTSVESNPISRDFLTRAPYSQFVANAGVPSPGPARVLSAGPGSEELRLIENAFPYAEPVIAENEGKAAVAFVYFNPDRPTLQATDISLIYYDGTTYSEPKTALTDTRAEFTPSIAFDQSGNVVAVWQRIKEENFTGQTTLDMARLMEIVYAVYTPSSSVWSQPVALTDNAFLNHSPMLARGQNGNLLLVWQSNEGNELIGDSTSPTTMHYTTWDGQAFSGAATIPQTFENAFDFSLAYGDSEAILAYVQDMDGNIATQEDGEVFYKLFNGSDWGAAIRLTDDTEPDVNPVTVYKGNGGRELVWLKGNRLVRLTDWSTGDYQVIREGSDSITFADFRLAKDSQDRLALIWQNIDDKGVDLFYSVYDPANASWSNDLRLTQDGFMEKDFEAVFAADGSLRVVYNKKDLVTGANDLYLLTHGLSTDLSIPAGGVSVQPETPAPGDQVTLSVQVENRGDLPLRNVPVSLYLGVSSDPARLIGTANVQPALLKAGDKGTASLSWAVPQTSDTYMVYAVVDPQDSVAESDETNNTVSFNVVQPDLDAAGLRVERHGDGSVDAIAVVQNNGAGAAANVEVLFQAEGVSLGIVKVDSLLPGQTAEVAHTMWANVDFESSPVALEAAIDPLDKIAETNEDNNQVFTQMDVAPEIAGYSVNGNLGNVLVNTSYVRSLSVMNTGDLNLVVGTLTLTGENASEFSLQSDGITGQTLAPSDIRIVKVVFSPTSKGAKTAALSISSNDPATPVFDIPLTAAGTVIAGPLHHIVVSPSNPSVQAGGAQTFTAVGFDQDDNERTGDVFSWSMTDASAGSIDAASGVLTAGTVAGTYDNVVTATSGSLTGSASVTVTPGPLHHLAISPADASVTVNGTQTYAASAFDEYGNERSGDPVVWSVTNADAGTINASMGAFVAGTLSGSYANVIAATSGVVTGTASVAVVAGALHHVAISPSHPSVPLEQNQVFTATTYDQYDNPRSGDPISWSCADPAAGTINAATGVFTATNDPANLGEHLDAIQATSGETNTSASVNIIGGIINGTVTLQGSSRPAAARAVGITTRLHAVGAANDVLNSGAGALATYTATTVDGGTNAVTFTLVGVTPGDYDVTIASGHTLRNVKKGVVVGAGVTTLSLGTLHEGNCNDDNIINALDFSILAASYMKSTGQSGWNAAADFDMTGTVNALDFSLLASNYMKSSPQTTP